MAEFAEHHFTLLPPRNALSLFTVGTGSPANENARKDDLQKWPHSEIPELADRIRNPQLRCKHAPGIQPGRSRIE